MKDKTDSKELLKKLKLILSQLDDDYYIYLIKKSERKLYQKNRYYSKKAQSNE